MIEAEHHLTGVVDMQSTPRVCRDRAFTKCTRPQRSLVMKAQPYQAQHSTMQIHIDTAHIHDTTRTRTRTSGACKRRTPEIPSLPPQITISSADTAMVSSMGEAQIMKKPVCVTQDGKRPRIDALYPRFSFAKELKLGDFPDDLANPDGACSGILTNVQTFREWRSQPAGCRFDIAESIFPEVGGWATNHLSRCVQDAFEFALYELMNDGEVQRFFTKYHPQPVCMAEQYNDGTHQMNDEALYDFERRNRIRRMSTEGSSSPLVARAGAEGGHWRHLKGSGGLLDSSSHSAANGSRPLTVADFLGIFVGWVVFTVGILSWSYVVPALRPHVRKHMPRFIQKRLARKKWALVRSEASLKRILATRKRSEMIDVHGAKIALDNEKGMLRALLKSTARIERMLMKQEEEESLPDVQAQVDAAAKIQALVRGRIQRSKKSLPNFTLGTPALGSLVVQIAAGSAQVNHMGEEVGRDLQI